MVTSTRLLSSISSPPSNRRHGLRTGLGKNPCHLASHGDKHGYSRWGVGSVLEARRKPAQAQEKHLDGGLSPPVY
jgi:hypothetical protein